MYIYVKGERERERGRGDEGESERERGIKGERVWAFYAQRELECKREREK